MNVRSREEALSFPLGEVALALCAGCGFVYNSKFEPDKVRYTSECEESQGYSPTFNAFARDLALSLVEKHNLRGKRIIEIGCGKGEFLKLICGLGGSSGVGFDPSFVPGRGEESNTAERIEFIADYYSEKYAHYQGDMICCRMTLEHIHETAGLVQTVRRSIGNRDKTVVFFQVPDATRIFQDCAFEDIYYEHCSYFSPGSLARLFRLAHFDLLDLKVVYGGQYLLIEARPAAGPTAMKMDLEDDLPSMKALVESFQYEHPATVRYWADVLKYHRKNGGRVVIWGSGSKGVAFLNAVEDSDQIECVVDINPHRQGTFMAGAGQEIVAPEFLKSHCPDAVIIMNKIYVDEINAVLKRLGLAPRIYALGEKLQKMS
jgi:SAM-dependent methyltransferase